MGRLVIDGENVYELDEECMQKKHQEELKQKRFQHTKKLETEVSDKSERKH